jgi:hypothetical protein
MAAYDEPAAKTVEEAAPAEPVVKLEQLWSQTVYSKFLLIYSLGPSAVQFRLRR